MSLLDYFELEASHSDFALSSVVYPLFMKMHLLLSLTSHLVENEEEREFFKCIIKFISIVIADWQICHLPCVGVKNLQLVHVPQELRDMDGQLLLAIPVGDAIWDSLRSFFLSFFFFFFSRHDFVRAISLEPLLAETPN